MCQWEQFLFTYLYIYYRAKAADACILVLFCLFIFIPQIFPSHIFILIILRSILLLERQCYNILQETYFVFFFFCFFGWNSIVRKCKCSIKYWIIQVLTLPNVESPVVCVNAHFANRFAIDTVLFYSTFRPILRPIRYTHLPYLCTNMCIKKKIYIPKLSLCSGERSMPVAVDVVVESDYRSWIAELLFNLLFPFCFLTFTETEILLTLHSLSS